MKKDLIKEKAELSGLIDIRKNQELKVIELRSNQDKANEEMRLIESEITKLESEKERIMQQRNEKEVNKRTIQIDIKEKQEKLDSYSEVRDIEGEKASIFQDLEKLQKRIMNLGPINFAAPETLEAEKQRKETLSGQIEELEISLNKLDEAIKIKKIEIKLIKKILNFEKYNTLNYWNLFFCFLRIHQALNTCTSNNLNCYIFSNFNFNFIIIYNSGNCPCYSS